MRPNWKLIASIAVCAICLTPTLVSYAPYSFRWDDADYLARSVGVSNAFWVGNWHEMRDAMVSMRPPFMTLLGLPWGMLQTWEASGKCFITLSAITASLIGCCLYLLLRMGLKPLYLAIISVCLMTALGPYPENSIAHICTTAFLADYVFAWDAFAVLLLVPFEIGIPAISPKEGLLRGVFWAVIFSVGAMTKVSFLYFVGLTIPILLFVRLRRYGWSGLWPLVSFTISLAPVCFYWLRYGLESVKYGWSSAFGHIAPLYNIPFWQFLGSTVRRSPGLLLPLGFATAGFVYVIVRRRDLVWDSTVLVLLLVIGYCAVALSSTNREFRFLIVGIIAPPFLAGVLLSRKTQGLSRGSAAIAALLTFCCLVAASLPMAHRGNRQCIARSQAVLAEAVERESKNVMLATNSPSLNEPLMRLAVMLSPFRHSVKADTLATHAAAGVPLEDDFRNIRESDLVVFQDQEALDPPFTNLRATEYEQYARQQFGSPVKEVGDVRIYCRICSGRARP
jgi:hypothetical protein